MFADEEIIEMALDIFQEHGLIEQGWTFHIVQELEEYDFTIAGITRFYSKQIIITKELWPTLNSNIYELILHEVAHVLCGHGDHSLEWWDKLVEIGGNGVWLDIDGDPSPMSWTREAIVNFSSFNSRKLQAL